MNMETPTIAAVAYGSGTSTFDMAAMLKQAEMEQKLAGHGARRIQQHFNAANAVAGVGGLPAAQPVQPPKETSKVTTRLVQVFIADPDENLPLNDRLLYSGEQKLTDLTDQELFFEVPIGDMLAKHNEKRAKMVNKKVKERTEHLEPARIRDLKMTVVNIAQF
jgi:hypothetical protein